MISAKTEIFCMSNQVKTCDSLKLLNTTGPLIHNIALSLCFVINISYPYSTLLGGGHLEGDP